MAESEGIRLNPLARSLHNISEHSVSSLSVGFGQICVWFPMEQVEVANSLITRHVFGTNDQVYNMDMQIM